MRKNFKTSIDLTFADLLHGKQVDFWFEQDPEEIKSRVSKTLGSYKTDDEPLVEDAIIVEE